RRCCYGTGRRTPSSSPCSGVTWSASCPAAALRSCAAKATSSTCRAGPRSSSSSPAERRLAGSVAAAHSHLQHHEAERVDGLVDPLRGRLALAVPGLALEP